MRSVERLRAGTFKGDVRALAKAAQKAQSDVHGLGKLMDSAGADKVRHALSTAARHVTLRDILDGAGDEAVVGSLVYLQERRVLTAADVELLRDSVLADRAATANLDEASARGRGVRSSSSDVSMAVTTAHARMDTESS